MTQIGGSSTDSLPPDTIRATLERVFASSEFDWREIQVPGLWAWLEERGSALLDWFGVLSVEHPVLYWLLLVVMVLVALALVAHLGYLAWRGVASVRPPETRHPGPDEVRNSVWYLAEARRLRDTGRFADALGHRFVALLLEMDRRKAVSYHPSKTPGDYVREANLADEGRSTLHDLVATLYRFLFGGDAPTAEDFDRFDHQAAELGGRHASV